MGCWTPGPSPHLLAGCLLWTLLLTRLKVRKAAPLTSLAQQKAPLPPFSWPGQNPQSPPQDPLFHAMRSAHTQSLSSAFNTDQECGGCSPPTPPLPAAAPAPSLGDSLSFHPPSHPGQSHAAARAVLELKSDHICPALSPPLQKEGLGLPHSRLTVVPRTHQAHAKLCLRLASPDILVVSLPSSLLWGLCLDITLDSLRIKELTREKCLEHWAAH